MIQLIDENFNVHAKRIPSLAPGMQVMERAGLTYVDSGLSCDTFNIIHVTNGQLLEQKTLHEALDHYRATDRDYCLWINEQELSLIENSLGGLGLARQNEEVGMVLDAASHQLVSHHKHAHIRIVDSQKALVAYAQVIAENWNPPDQNVLAYYEATAAHYLNAGSGIILLVYYYQNQPVATVELFPTDEQVLGIYGLATKASVRGMGIGSAMMTYALNLAKERGYTQVVLQASADGLGIYQRMGFVQETMYYEYA